MIGVAICGGLVCAFAAGYCMGYVIHKQRLPKVEEAIPPYRDMVPKPKRDAKGRFTK